MHVRHPLFRPAGAWGGRELAAAPRRRPGGPGPVGGGRRSGGGGEGAVGEGVVGSAERCKQQHTGLNSQGSRGGQCSVSCLLVGLVVVARLARIVCLLSNQPGWLEKDVKLSVF